MDKNEPKSRYTQLLRKAKNRVNNLLNMDMLDSDTQQLILHEAISTSPTSLSRLNLPSINITKGSRAQKPSSAMKPFLTPLKSSEGEQLKVDDVEGEVPTYLKACVKPGSGGLITAMAARLKELEKMHKIYQSELKEMNGKYHELEVDLKEESQKRAEAERLLVELYDEKKHLEELVQERRLRDQEDMRDGSQESIHSRNAKRRLPGGLTASPKPSSPSFDLYAGDYTGDLSDPRHMLSSSPREAQHRPKTPENVRLTVERGSVDPRGPLLSSASTPVMLFNPSPRAGAGSNAVRRAQRPSSATTPPLDIPLMVRNARVLSDHVGWKAVVVSDGQGRIANREVVRVVVYKNGISVNNGAFRPFEWALCKAFVQDLMEGYYPYEFKDRYPSGFPIEVVDKSSEEWIPSSNKTEPASVGTAVNVTANLRPSNVHSLQVLRGPPERERFLQQLPVTRVTANGHLVGVRGAIASLFQGGNAGLMGPGTSNRVEDTIRHITPAERAYRASLSKSESQPPQGDETEIPKNDVMVMGNLISILVRLPSGKKVVMRMSPDDTVEQLYRELLAAAPEITRTYVTFEVCQAFPFRVHRDRSETLKKLGLSGNCTLLLRATE